MSQSTDTAAGNGVPPKGVFRVPLMGIPIVAALLAMIAGSMDGFTFFSAGTFSTVQSGNMVQIGYWIAKSNFAKVVDVGLSVVAFGLGAVLSTLIINYWERRGRIFTPHVLSTEAAILAIVGLPFVGGEMGILLVAYIVAFVAGMQGNAFHKSEGMMVGNVAVTLNIQLAFHYMASASFEEKSNNMKKSGIYFLVLLGYALGGVLGGYAASLTDVKALWLPAALLLALSFVAVSKIGSTDWVDPTA